MAIRLVPLLVDNLVTKGIKASVCDNSYTNGEKASHLAPFTPIRSSRALVFAQPPRACGC